MARTSACRPPAYVLAMLLATGVAGASNDNPPPAPLLMPSPLRAVNPPPADANRPVQHLSLDVALYESIKHADGVHLRGLPIAPGQTIDLDLHRFDILTSDARVVVADADHEHQAAPADIILLRGTVAGHQQSSVYLALSPHGSNGYILFPHQTWVIATPPPTASAAASATVIYNLSGIAPDAIAWRAHECRADEHALANPDPLQLVHRLRSRHAATIQNASNAPGASLDSGPALTCRRVRIAIETDWEYTGDVFGGDTAASHAYALALMGAVNEIYIREVNTRLEVVYLRVWESNQTPYAQSGAQLFGDFKTHWRANMTGVTRDIAHMLSGIRYTGAVAGLADLCAGEFAYGLSVPMNGSFPIPYQHNHPQNWDPVIIAHEIGHNFGALHTHGLTPPIDRCGATGTTNCDDAHLGTIMSYCFFCGLQHIRLDLHERIISETILPYLQSAPCASALLCPQAGACCLPSGCCVLRTPAECASEAGVYRGDGTSCDACPQPLRACCFPDGSCAVLTPDDCCSQGGTKAGAHTSCAAANCQPRGACCLPGGPCLIRTAPECAAVQGVYRGHGSECTPESCPGACCLSAGECTILTGAQCASAHGAYRGDGTICGTGAGLCCETWRPLGSGMTIAAPRSSVEAFAVHGDLIAAGAFNMAGGAPANSIARWDGDQWHPVGGGLTLPPGPFDTPTIRALAVFDGDLIVAGTFDFAGPPAISGLAAWNGAAWQTLGAGVGGGVSALALHDSRLVVGGSFTTAGGQPAARIAAWDGAAWSPLGAGVNGTVRSLGVFNNDLIAGGSFTTAGGVNAKSIARWDGVNWHPLDTGVCCPTGTFVPQPPMVLALTTFDGELIAAGRFQSAGSAEAHNIAAWNGTSWRSLGAGIRGWDPTLITVDALQVYRGRLVAGGTFTKAGNQFAADYIAQWDGTTWARMGGMGLRGSARVLALTLWNGEIVAGGHFELADGQIVNKIAAWRSCESGPCYANCDNSTAPPILNIDDFTCFINQFAAAQSLPHAQQLTHYANCDRSTTTPALNVDDFTCFINAFAAGCP